MKIEIGETDEKGQAAPPEGEWQTGSFNCAFWIALPVIAVTLACVLLYVVGPQILVTLGH